MRYYIKYIKDIAGDSCHILIKFKELEDMNDLQSRMKILDPEILGVKNHQKTPVIRINYDLPHDPKYTFLRYGGIWTPFTISKSDLQWSKNLFEFDSDEEALLFFEVYDG